MSSLRSRLVVLPRITRIGLSLFAVASLAGCGEEPTPTEPVEPVAATVAISPASLVLSGRTPAELTTTVRDQSGELMSGLAVAWTSENPSVAVLGLAADPGAVVVRSGFRGSTTVTARVGTVSASVPVMVDVPQIAFSSSRDGTGQIYVMDTDGSNQLALTNDPSSENQVPTWSPDGTKIAFMTDRDGDLEIYVMDSDGSNQVNLTDTPEKHEAHPAWSPDGTKIAFNAILDTGAVHVYVMDADGANPVNLSASSVGGWDPAWSPDGTKIAFTSAGADLYVMDSDGSNRVKLTNDPAFDGSPSWSPDGAKIAFTSSRTRYQDVYVMNGDGSGLINLTNDPVAADVSPAWSPDGTKIVFAKGNWDIYVMNSDGSNVINLTNRGGGNAFPAWSPDHH